MRLNSKSELIDDPPAQENLSCFYRKLQLFCPKSSKVKYFESISWEKFNNIVDKHLFSIETLKVQKIKDKMTLGSIKLKLSNGEVSKHIGGYSLDLNASHTLNLKDVSLASI